MYQVKEQWVSYNFNGLPINEVRHDYASVMVDSQSLLTVVNNVAQHQQHSNHQLLSLKNTLDGYASNQKLLMDMNNNNSSYQTTSW